MKEDRNQKKGKKGFLRIINAFLYSKEGLMAAWIDESAFRQVLTLGLICIIVAFFIGSSWTDRVLLILPCMISILIELINSAIENAIDFTGLEFHPFAKKAKDMGSAAQFVALIFWIGVWGSFLWSEYL
ncbi:diacylglycerol kinase [Helicobacter sp. 13S00477-4]|uniref:diacylglycerol kinase n=1 Tax=Helicobacter sp. 13S00477-4 TaxID=1905759 RepID=UPI000BA59AEB|nr:diacylglycerol kinase [Helicobacter sp. 13S00477-4]PAF52042.1 diacylglycerol kinase [Helicobacter sp. 13S00477-4]